MTSDDYRNQAIAAAGATAGDLTDDELTQAMTNMKASIHKTQQHLALIGIALAIRQGNDGHLNYWLSTLDTNTEVADWFSGMNPDPPDYVLDMIKR